MSPSRYIHTCIRSCLLLIGPIRTHFRVGVTLLRCLGSNSLPVEREQACKDGEERGKEGKYRGIKDSWEDMKGIGKGERTVVP